MRSKYLESALNKHCMVTVALPDGTILEANDNFCEKSGYTREELVGQDHRLVNSGFHPKEFFEALWATVLNGDEFTGEVCNKAKDGSLWWSQTTIVPQCDGDKIIRFVTLRTDITDRILAQKNVDRTNKIMNNSLSEIFMFDAETLKFIDVNYGARKNIGYTMKELSKMTPMDIKPYLPNDEFLKMIEPLRTDHNKIQTFETKNRRKDGSEYDVEVHLQHMNEDYNMFVAVILDITDRKRQQTELLQSQKMTSLGELTGGIAHDFNNVLGSILGFSQLMEMQLKKGEYDKERMLKYIDIINSSGTRAKELVSNMMSFSRKTSSDDTTKYKLYDLSKLVNESLELLSSVLPSSIVITKHINTRTFIKSNNIKLHQLVMNLCINARDAMKDVGHLEVGIRPYSRKESCSSCAESIRGEYVELYISDDGEGMPPKIIQRIFDPFFSTKTVGKGSGMGLSIVHGIMHDHGGHVVVQSVTDEGTTVSLLFPKCEQPECTKDDQLQNAYEPMPGKGREILIVDDEEMIGQFLSELVRRYDYNPVYKQSSLHALQYYKENHEKIAVIVTDQTMPELTGVALTEQMTEINPEVNVIICSGNIDKVDMSTLNRQCAVLPKPLNMDDFFQELDNLIH